MHSFPEELLQFIWRYRLLKPGPYTSVSGAAIEIVQPGELNHDSGPDFFNGQLRVNGVLLSGNIEIHIKSSDWIKHDHQHDSSYDNLILHAVYEHDRKIEQNTKHSVEVLILKDYITAITIERYQQLCGNAQKLPCAGSHHLIDASFFKVWLESMNAERLQQRNNQLSQLFTELKGDYTQLLYILLLKNFGFKINAVPFEMLASQLPLSTLLKHSDNLLQVECLLFGTAGLLDAQYSDPYVRSLQNEFEFLRKKYGIQPLHHKLFKFSRLRPANFPSLRLAQLAALVHHRRRLFSTPLDIISPEQISDMLNVKLQGYWLHHYTLDGSQGTSPLHMGTEARENILINTFAPFYFFYGKRAQLMRYEQLSHSILDLCKAENNIKTRLFMKKFGAATSAIHSQGMIQLYDKYCSKKACLKCNVGLQIVSGTNQREFQAISAHT